MIKCLCDTAEHYAVTDMAAFQGDLKIRKPRDLAALCDSLLEEGLIMPFALWRSDDKLYLLDGHGRREAIIKLALAEPELLTQKFPCLVIDAASEDEARKALLQISSTYGKVSKRGLQKFVEPIQGYTAPIIPTATKKVVREKVSDTVIIRLKVMKDKVELLKTELAKVTGVEVL